MITSCEFTHGDLARSDTDQDRPEEIRQPTASDGNDPNARELQRQAPADNERLDLLFQDEALIEEFFTEVVGA